MILDTPVSPSLQAAPSGSSNRAQPAPCCVAARSAPLSRWAAGAGLSLLWGIAVRTLHVDWTVNAQYNYGWMVPILTGYLIWTRWQTRPAASARPGAVWPMLLGGLLLLVHFPVRVIQEANPEWRVVSWFVASEVVAITLGFAWFKGGRSWLGHMAFPVCFFLVAVPWPTWIEQPLQQHLMRLDAMCAVEGLRWAGIAAVQQGNLIELAGGLVGVDEACSGLRSLQTTLMLAVFLGEFQRLRVRARAILMVVGLAVAFIPNLVRALGMALLAGSYGLPAVDRWHDAAGYAVLVLSVAMVWPISRALGSPNGEAADRPNEKRNVGHPLPLAAGLCLAGWLLFTEGVTELWYLAHERNPVVNAEWSVSWPVSSPGFKETPIRETARAILAYSSGRSAVWMRPDGTQWQMVFLKWDAGRGSAQLAARHQPEICLPASGRVLKADLGIRQIQAGRLTLPFRACEFRDRGIPLHVYHCLWQDRSARAPALGGGDAVADRIKAAWEGRRNLGQRSIEIAIWGCGSAAEAEWALKRFLDSPGRIRIGGATSA